MKSIFTILSILILSSTAVAQRPGTNGVLGLDLGSSRFADLQQTDSLPYTGDTSPHPALVLGDGNTVTAARGYVLYGLPHEHQNPGEATPLIVLGESDMFLAPIGLSGEGGLTSFKAESSFEVNKTQAANISNDKELANFLTIKDGNIVTASNGARLFSTGGSDCSSARVTCGVVFEIETTLTFYGIGSGG